MMSDRVFQEQGNLGRSLALSFWAVGMAAALVEWVVGLHWLVVGRIDAAFTDIVSVSTGEAFADAKFTNTPASLADVTRTEVEMEEPLPPETESEFDVTATMSFDAGVAGSRIRGGFVGPDRAEVAGVFEQNGILGAFGAERE